MTEDRIPESLLDYLETATKPELEQFELLKLARASDIAKHIKDSILELVKAEGEALVARVLIERRKKVRVDTPPKTARELVAEVIPSQSLTVLEEKLRRMEHPNGGRNGKKA